MAYITIVSTNKPGKLDVSFGDYGDGKKIQIESRFNTSDIEEIDKYNDYVAVKMRNGIMWYLVCEFYENNNYRIVDLIDGVPPSDIDNLYNLVKNL